MCLFVWKIHTILNVAVALRALSLMQKQAVLSFFFQAYKSPTWKLPTSHKAIIKQKLYFFFLEYYSKIFVLNLFALLAFGSFFILTVLPNVPYRNFPRFQFFSSVVGRTLALASTLNCSGAVLEEFAVRGYWSPC